LVKQRFREGYKEIFIRGVGWEPPWNTGSDAWEYRYCVAITEVNGVMVFGKAKSTFEENLDRFTA
jgi:hypothetical protein